MQATREPRRLCDFAHPLEALESSHALFREQLARLRELAERSRAGACDEGMQQAAADLMRYFDTAGRLHYEDEECDLFPGLAAAALGPNAGRVALLVRQVEQQHRAMELGWTAVKSVLARLVHGEAAPLAESVLGRFERACRAHLALAKDRLIPLAAVLLDTPELELIGRGMAQRRGMKMRANPSACAA